jgi:hypothetical protein
MIEVNLLEEKKKMRLPVVMGIDLNDINIKAIIIVYVLGYFGEDFNKAHWAEKLDESQKTIQKHQKEYSILRKEIRGNEGIKTKLEAYNKQIGRLKKKSKKVEKILNLRTNPKKLLEKVARIIPEDLWISSLKIDEKKKVKIEGNSTTYKSIGSFLVKANDTTYFGKSLGLLDSKTKEVTIDGEKIRVESFKIEGRVNSFGTF